MAGGIFSIENWSEELRAKDSVRPLLTVLEQHGDARVIHQRVATQPEVGYYLHRFSELKNYPIGYLATGPHAGAGQLASDHITLETLLGWAVNGPATPDTDDDDEGETEPRGRLLDLTGKVVVLAGSSSLRCTPTELKELQTASGAVLICGYGKDVPWAAAAGFELILLSALAQATAGRRHAVPDTVRRLWRISGQLMDDLGFITAPDYDPAAETSD